MTEEHHLVHWWWNEFADCHGCPDLQESAAGQEMIRLYNCHCHISTEQGRRGTVGRLWRELHHALMGRVSSCWSQQGKFHTWSQYLSIRFHLQTYNSDYMVSDSASTAFAMYSGTKTSGYTMGYDYSVRYMDMSSEENATRVSTILDWAQDNGQTPPTRGCSWLLTFEGMKTGFVTTTRMSHATPAALYSRLPFQCLHFLLECTNESLLQNSVQILGMRTGKYFRK